MFWYLSGLWCVCLWAWKAREGLWVSRGGMWDFFFFLGSLRHPRKELPTPSVLVETAKVLDHSSLWPQLWDIFISTKKKNISFKSFDKYQCPGYNQLQWLTCNSLMIIILLTVYVIHWKIHGNPNLSSVEGVRSPGQCICIWVSPHRTLQDAWWWPLGKLWHRYKSVPEVLSHMLFLVIHAKSHFRCLALNASSLSQAVSLDTFSIFPPISMWSFYVQ